MPNPHRLVARLTLRACAAGALLLAAPVAQAGFLDDLLKTRTEVKEVFLVYDLPQFAGQVDAVQEAVRIAVTYQGDNAYVKTHLVSGAPPAHPGKLTVKPMQFPMGISVNMPSCDGADFTVSSSDNSMASYGDSAR